MEHGSRKGFILLQEQVAEAFSAFGQARTGGSGTFHRLEYFRTNYLKKYAKGFAEKSEIRGVFRQR